MDRHRILTGASDMIHGAITEHGILASPVAQDNYKKIWSRDSMIAMVAGFYTDDVAILEGGRRSITTLLQYQHPLGMIPTNVSPDGLSVSYGQLVGRVDSTAWLLLGASLYLQHNDEFKETWYEQLLMCIQCLDYWEYNAKDMVYTPMSGNWADEYPINGYTLYDNALRYWAYVEFQKLYQDEVVAAKMERASEKITHNFWPTKEGVESPITYHKTLYASNVNSGRDHWLSSLAPGGFSNRFDCAATALVILSGLAQEYQIDRLGDYLKNLKDVINTSLVPVFWPVISELDPEWEMLQNNYSYEFKNRPYHFQNGGVWPVWMGLLVFALNKSGNSYLANDMKEALNAKASESEWNYQEYISSDTMDLNGKSPLVFSASGLIFNNISIQ